MPTSAPGFVHTVAWACVYHSFNCTREGVVEPRRLAGAEPTKARRCHSERDRSNRSRMLGANLCPQLPHLLCWPLTDGPQRWSLTAATFLGSRTLWVQNSAGHRRKRLVSAPPGPGPRRRAGGSADRSLLWAATLPGSGSKPGGPQKERRREPAEGWSCCSLDHPLAWERRGARRRPRQGLAKF